MTTKNQTEIDQKELSLEELLGVLRRGKWLILWMTVACTVAAGVAARLLPKQYDAITLLAPVSSSPGSSGGLSGLASQFGSLASLAGLSGSGDSKKSESLAVLQSEALTERYIQANNLLPVLYPNKWDPQNMRWKDIRPEGVPTPWKANQYFKKNVRVVSIDAKTGLVTLTITWNNPVIAAKWANDLVKMANDYLRNNAIAESERNIAYLNDEAAKTNVVEVRQAIYAILRDEINKAMLARGSEQYAFRILDPAVAPERPSSPLLLNWLLLGMFGGLLLAVSAVLVRSSWTS
jgi:uncharacterized protein involved in exopolysaccharide biosynthesis